MAWKLACMLGTCRKCDPNDGFSKYELHNKLLDSIILLKVTLSIIWTQLLYKYIGKPEGFFLVWEGLWS